VKVEELCLLRRECVALVEIYRRFGGTYFLHPQGRRECQAIRCHISEESTHQSECLLITHMVSGTIKRKQAIQYGWIPIKEVILFYSWLPLEFSDNCESGTKRLSQWPHGLRHEMSSPDQTLGSWVRIPLEAWMSVCVFSVCAVLCAGSGLAMG
jgi:hypothetical protein